MTAATRPARPPAPDFPYGPRGVETGLVRAALPWLGAVVPVALLAGWLAAGTDGLVSAALGCLLAVANLYASAFVLERAARRGANVLMGATLGSFVLRLLVLTGIVFALSKLAFVDVAVLGIVLVCTHLALLILESAAVVRADRAAAYVSRAPGSSIDRADDKEDA